MREIIEIKQSHDDSCLHFLDLIIFFIDLMLITQQLLKDKIITLSEMA